MADEIVLYQVDDKIGIITLNRDSGRSPDERNRANAG